MRDAMHPPKRVTFDLRAGANTDPKGVLRAVDEYTVQPWGLYVARPTPGRAHFHYLESWLLPSLGLRATVFHFNPGFEPAPTRGTPRTTTSTSRSARGRGPCWPTSTSCSRPSATACWRRRSP